MQFDSDSYWALFIKLSDVARAARLQAEIRGLAPFATIVLLFLNKQRLVISTPRYFNRRSLEIPSRSRNLRRVNTTKPTNSGGIGGMITAANLNFR